MARNLYDVGDRCPERTGSWLNEKEERRSRVMPLGGLLLALLVGVVGLLLLSRIVPASGSHPAVAATRIDQDFDACDDPQGAACVVDADHYAWRGRLYRVADMRAPSLSRPACPAEAAAAARGRAALRAMMNGGGFDALPDPSGPDASARLLIRDGVSLGQLMVLKGHARPWSDRRPDWCAG
jgi:endonuclease YncB( thermonuclease family)